MKELNHLLIDIQRAVVITEVNDLNSVASVLKNTIEYLNEIKEYFKQPYPTYKPKEIGYYDVYTDIGTKYKLYWFNGLWYLSSISHIQSGYDIKYFVKEIDIVRK